LARALNGDRSIPCQPPHQLAGSSPSVARVNQYETQYVKETLEINGYREADDGEAADLCVVNTCTVTGEGDAKSRTAVRRCHQRNPCAQIVVMGCYATRDPGAVAKLRASSASSLTRASSPKNCAISA